MGLHPGTRPVSTRSLTLSWRGGLPHALSRHGSPSRDQAGLYQTSHAILEGRAPARPVSPWVSIPGPGRALPDLSRYPGGAGSCTPCPAMVFIQGPGRRGRRLSNSGSARSLTLSWRGGLLHALSRHGSPSRDQAVTDGAERSELGTGLGNHGWIQMKKPPRSQRAPSPPRRGKCSLDASLIMNQELVSILKAFAGLAHLARDREAPALPNP